MHPSDSKNKKTVFLVAAFFLLVSLLCLLQKEKTYSLSERRTLRTLPAFTADAYLSGTWMEDLEAYTLDQFPGRDAFRSLKAASTLFLLGQSDNNGIYLAEGHLSEMEYPLQETMLTRAADTFTSLYDEYLADTNTHVYYAIVPDKNYFLAEKNGHLSMDYDRIAEDMEKALPFMTCLDLYPLLSLEDYYRTDPHWKQECLTDVARQLLVGMDALPDGAEGGSAAGGTDSAGSADSAAGSTGGANAAEGVLLSDYTLCTLDTPFYGAYYGHLGLPLPADTINYLVNDTLQQCVVTSYSTGSPVPSVLYNQEKATGRDPYEFFLSGSEALLTIENPAADTDRELVIFRDSFASSLAPLLVSGYARITLVDIRYMQSAYVGNFITFDDQDVLFLYSTLLLNNSGALR